MGQNVLVQFFLDIKFGFTNIDKHFRLGGIECFLPGDVFLIGLDVSPHRTSSSFKLPLIPN